MGNKLNCTVVKIGGHTYFISDREIQPNEWIFDEHPEVDFWYIRQCPCPNSYHGGGYYKVEATTHKTLGLPLIPNINIETSEVWIQLNPEPEKYPDSSHEMRLCDEWKTWNKNPVKVNEKNEIIILGGKSHEPFIDANDFIVINPGTYNERPLDFTSGLLEHNELNFMAKHDRQFPGFNEIRPLFIYKDETKVLILRNSLWFYETQVTTILELKNYFSEDGILSLLRDGYIIITT